jgi:hypothetical protein
MQRRWWGDRDGHGRGSMSEPGVEARCSKGGASARPALARGSRFGLVRVYLERGMKPTQALAG